MRQNYDSFLLVIDETVAISVSPAATFANLTFCSFTKITAKHSLDSRPCLTIQPLSKNKKEIPETCPLIYVT